MESRIREITEGLRAWAGRALTDPRLGVPPDARLNVAYEGVGQGWPQTKSDRPEPARVQIKSRRFELRFLFREDEDPEILLSIGVRLREAADADLTLGGRVRKARVPEGDFAPQQVADGIRIVVPVTVYELERVAT